MDWGFLAEPLTLALLAAALAATVAVRVASWAIPGLDVPFLGRLVPWMPFAIRLHLGVSLVGLLSMGDYLSPAMDLPQSIVGILLGAALGVVAVRMVTGWHARPAAWLLLAAGPIGMLEYGVSPVLQRIDLVGLALFVLLAGPGRWSADRERGAAAEPGPADLARAVWALRIAAGAALIIVALVEKLANPDLALAFLAEHPDFNVARLVGLPMGDLEFTRLAGAIEVLFGLLLISGALPQLCVLIAGIPFNATLYFFGTQELVGHLPVYGAMLVLLVLGSDAAMRPAVSDLGPWSRGAVRRRTAAATAGR